MKKLREASGLTQKQVADLLGVTIGYVSAMECGKRKLGLTKIIQMSEIYKVPIATILQTLGYNIKQPHIVISDKTDGGVIASITGEDIILHNGYAAEIEFI